MENDAKRGSGVLVGKRIKTTHFGANGSDQDLAFPPKKRQKMSSSTSAEVGSMVTNSGDSKGNESMKNTGDLKGKTATTQFKSGKMHAGRYSSTYKKGKLKIITVPDNEDEVSFH